MNYARLRILAIAGVLAGWGGLYWVIYTLPPDTLGLGIGFILLLLASWSSAVLPLTMVYRGWYNRQIRSAPKVKPRLMPVAIVARQALWLALIAEAAAALQLFGLLDWQILIVLLAIFILIEIFLGGRGR